MKDINLWISLYALGVVVSAMIIFYDMRKLQDKGYVFMSESIKRVVILSLWSWVLVYFRFAFWFMDYMAYLCVKFLFQYKVWRNRKRNNNIK